MIYELIKMFGLSFFLAIIISYVYAFIKSNLSFSQNYIRSIVLLTLITTLIMLVIGNNIARAFTLVGALAIIRFRTPLKDPIDMVFIFFALSVGMGIGTKNWFLTASSTVIISFLAILISYFKITFGKNNDYLLKVRVDSQNPQNELLSEILKKYFHNIDLVNSLLIKSEAVIEKTYFLTVQKKQKQNLNLFIEEANKIESVKEVLLVSKEQDLEE